MTVALRICPAVHAMYVSLNHYCTTFVFSTQTSASHNEMKTKHTDHMNTICRAIGSRWHHQPLQMTHATQCSAAVTDLGKCSCSTDYARRCVQHSHDLLH